MALVLVISIGFLVPKAAARSDKYSKMAPVDQYLMERNAEILVARSAAPDSISSDATILVLGRQGYEFGFPASIFDCWKGSIDGYQADDRGLVEQAHAVADDEPFRPRAMNHDQPHRSGIRWDFENARSGKRFARSYRAG